MAEAVARVATTHPMEQAGVEICLTKESLESASEQANGERAIPFTVEHDPFCLPIGKTTEAWVEPYGPEYALMARIFIEDKPQSVIHEGSKIELVYLNFEDSPKPFLMKATNIEDYQIEVIVDFTSLPNKEESDSFLEDLKVIDSEASLRHGGRFSLGPEPLVQFILSNPDVSLALAIGGWSLNRVEKFVRYTIDETLRKVADEISDSWSGKLIDFFKAYKNRQSKDDRPTVSQIIVPTDDFHLVLLARIENDEEHPRLDFEELTTEMSMYVDLLEDAEEVTFARKGTDGWEFAYLKTKSGKVVGTRECYEKTLEKQGSNTGVSLHIGNVDKENSS